MDIALGVFLEVGDEAVGTLHGVVEVVIDRWVVHQFAERSFGTLNLFHRGMNAADGLVDASERGLQVELVHLVGQGGDVPACFCEGARHLWYVVA